jgi:hypothetical protein
MTYHHVTLKGHKADAILTDLQKQEIQKLYAEGFGHSKIASTMRIKATFVQGYLYRNGLYRTPAEAKEKLLQRYARERAKRDVK